MTKERFIEIATEEMGEFDPEVLEKLWETRPSQVDLMTDAEVLTGLRVAIHLFAIQMHGKAMRN
jgi:hypothetical protein